MDREPGRVQRIAALIVSLGMVWYMLPDHHRELIRMRVVHVAQRAAARVARAEGQTGMGEELSGRPGAAERHYTAALHLSKARDAFSRVLESMRP
jgi:hypothetical protein